MAAVEVVAAVEAVPQNAALGGDAVVTLPKYVVFKGDNDKYLGCYWTEEHEYLRFSRTDIGIGEVRNEVVEVGDGSGTVMLKSLYWNKFWRRSPNWIWADTINANTSNKDLLYQPIKVDDKRVGLRCLGNNAFCKRLTIEGKSDCLNAGTSTLESTAIFQVEEPVLSQTVNSIVYDLDNATMYDLQPGTLFYTTVTNPSDQTATLEVSYSYTDSKSTSWNCGVSFTTGVTTTIEAGVPLVVDGKVEVSASITVSSEWGGTQENDTTVTGTYSTPVGPGQTAGVTVVGANAQCDVPFSYTQEDVLTTGETVVTTKSDGVFKGMNTTDVTFVVTYL